MKDNNNDRDYNTREINCEYRQVDADYLEMSLVRRFCGAEANTYREFLSSKARQDVINARLADFDYFEMMEVIKFEWYDYADQNCPVLYENYRIKGNNFKDELGIENFFYPSVIENTLPTLQIADRIGELRIPHPVHVKENIVINFHQDYPDSEFAELKIDSEYFYFSHSLKRITPREFAYAAEYKSNLNAVPAEKLSEFKSMLSEIGKVLIHFPTRRDSVPIGFKFLFGTVFSFVKFLFLLAVGICCMPIKKILDKRA